jgi:hypothetical protein
MYCSLSKPFDHAAVPLLLLGIAVARWGGWFIAAAFAGILVWEEVWDLPNTAYLSGWLLLLITGRYCICRRC